MLTVLGLSFIVSLAGRNLIKGFIMAALGFLLAMVGLDPQSSIQRFTFGQLYLWKGSTSCRWLSGCSAAPKCRN